MSQYDVFISYESANHADATSLYNALQYHGFSCWMDNQRILGGDQIPEVIAAGIRSCRFLCAVVTANYSRSYYGRMEDNLMRAREGLLAPVRIVHCLFDSSPPIFIGNRAFIDFFYQDFHAALDSLVKSLRTHNSVIQQRVDTAKVVGIGLAGAIALLAAVKLSDDDSEPAAKRPPSRPDTDSTDIRIILIERAQMARLRNVVKSWLPELPVPTRKADLAALIVHHLDLSAALLDDLFTANDLRELCSVLSLGSRGTKREMAARLLEYIDAS